MYFRSQPLPYYIGLGVPKEGKNMSKQTKPTVGGQALIEGIMMQSPTAMAMAVRMADNTIDVEELPPIKRTFANKIPIIRGIVSFITTMKISMDCMTKSAEKTEEPLLEPETKFERWLMDTFGEKLTGVVVAFGMVLGMLLAGLLFMLLPSLLTKALSDYVIDLGNFKALVEGVVKITIFTAYLWTVSLNPDIKRVFQYHGAEHKTIFCFENELELTVENVKKQIRFHPRCGTSFMIITLIISIMIFSLPIIPWDNVLLRTGIKIVLIPLLLGISYEFIKLAGKYDNWFTRMISYPGVMLQHLTTCEPDESQIEVAIASLIPCLTDEEVAKYAPNYVPPTKPTEVVADGTQSDSTTEDKADETQSEGATEDNADGQKINTQTIAELTRRD